MTEHEKAEWFWNEHMLPDGSYINKDGDVCYVKNGKFHREDGPTVELANGERRWYIDNELHREDGPAIEWANGGKSWYVNGKRHRYDGPAIECPSGRKEWYINGKKHKTKEDYEEALKIWKMNEAMR